MMLLTMSFVVVIRDVGIHKVTLKYRKFPHTINLLLCVSAWFGRISHTIRPYVTFFVAKGASLLGMNFRVFVHFIIVPTLWDNPPNLFANNLNHVSLSGPFIRCLYYCTYSVIGFRTEFAWSKICSAANVYCGFVSNFEYFDLRLYLLISRELSGFTLGETSGFTLGSLLGSSGGISCGTLCCLFVSVWSCFPGIFSIGCILGCAWVCFVGTWLMFPLLKFLWRSAIDAIYLSAMFWNGDAGDGF